MSIYPESTKCPVYYEVYPGKIFQCSKGHAICHLCYEKCLTKTKNCPTCQIPFGKEPIRCLVAEAIMGEHGLRKKVDCPFKSSGCDKQVDSNLVEEHADSCKYNLQKFGSLINICEKIRSKKCTFTVNKSNVAEWIKHARKVHNASYGEKLLSTSTVPFKEYITVCISDAAAVSASFYDPAIYNFKKECFAIVVVMEESKNLFITPYILGYGAEAEKAPNCEVKFTFTTVDDDRLGNKKIKMSVSPVDILKINKYPKPSFGCVIPFMSLKMESDDDTDDEDSKCVSYVTEIVVEK